MSGAPDGPNAFDYLEGPIATDPGTLADYEASLSEYLGASFGYAMDLNPAQLIAREADFLAADFQALAGATGWVDPETAKKEIAEAKLNLTVPEGGISRFELNTLKYLKQQEIARQSTFSRRSGPLTSVLGFGAGLAASATDPLNVASAFLPVVPELRYAQWLAAANSASARAAIRAGVGAVEGAAGAALIEPFVYAGATSQQFDYSAIDSFMNVAFGTALGGGLHTGGGAAFDYFNASTMKALKGLDEGIVGNLSLLQRAAEDAPESVKMEALHVMTRALEDDVPGDVAPLFEAWHASPHAFDRFDMAKVGSGEGQQAFGHGIYLSESEAISGRNGYYETQFQETHGAANIYQVQVTASPDDFLDWRKPLGEQSPQVQAAIKRIPQVEQLGADSMGMDVYSVLLNSKKADGSAFTKADISEVLKAAGVKGIRHASEEDGGKSRNLVVFDDKDVKVVSRNGEPVAQPQSTPRDLSGLIQQSRADRTQEAFNRQFVEDPTDVQVSRAADEAVTRADDDLQAVSEDLAFLDQQIQGLKAREMWTNADDEAIAQGDEAAKNLEKEASIYRAAAVCMMED